MTRTVVFSLLFISLAVNPAKAQVQYELKAMNSNKCAHVQAASQDNGGRISLWTCNANHLDRQDGVSRECFKWRKIPEHGQWFKLQAVHSKKCAQVNQASLENGAPITQWDCVNQANVYWRLAPADNNLYYIVNRASGKCMHVHGGKNENGALITQWECINQYNLKWIVTGLVRID